MIEYVPVEWVLMGGAVVAVFGWVAGIAYGRTHPAVRVEYPGSVPDIPEPPPPPSYRPCGTKVGNPPPPPVEMKPSAPPAPPVPFSRSIEAGEVIMAPLFPAYESGHRYWCLVTDGKRAWWKPVEGDSDALS